MVEPDGRHLTEEVLYQHQHLLVRDCHKVLQTLLASLPGTHVPEVDPETFQQDLRWKTGEEGQRSALSASTEKTFLLCHVLCLILQFLFNIQLGDGVFRLSMCKARPHLLQVNIGLCDLSNRVFREGGVPQQKARQSLFILQEVLQFEA